MKNIIKLEIAHNGEKLVNVELLTYLCNLILKNINKFHWYPNIKTIYIRIYKYTMTFRASLDLDDDYLICVYSAMENEIALYNKSKEIYTEIYK